MNVTVAEMKANFSEILRKASKGEEINVTKHGKPYVKIASDKPKKPGKLHGVWKGKFVLPDDFDDIPTGFEEYFN